MTTASITLTDGPNGTYSLKGEFAPSPFDPKSPSHQLAWRLVKEAEQLGLKTGEVQNTTDEIVEMTEEQNRAFDNLILRVYEWLGTYKLEMPIAAVAMLQEILGPLPANTINLDAKPMDVSQN